MSEEKRKTLMKYAEEKLNIDFPLCSDCVDNLMKTWNDEYLQMKQNERKYLLFLENYLNDYETKDGEVDSLKKELEGLDEELSELVQQEKNLDSLKKEFEDDETLLNHLVRDEIIKRKTVELEYKDATVYWKDAEAMYHRELAHLEKLQHMTILNEIFHIWYAGHIGTINGFRLGRTATQPVDWMEINSAFGQVANLLVVAEKLLEYEFKKYKFLLRGSFTKVFVVHGGQCWDLVGGQGGLFWKSRFDKAVVGILESVGELEEVIQAKDPSFELFYPIKSPTIGTLSIKFPSNEKGEPRWSRALKYLLTNLKRISTWLDVKIYKAESLKTGIF